MRIVNWIGPAIVVTVLAWVAPVNGQSISSGTVSGTVADQSGAVIPGVTVEIRNDITRYQQLSTTDVNGLFRFTNVPFNGYLLTATLSGFKTATQNLAIRSTVPQDVKLTMSVGGLSESVTVEGGAGVVENIPTAHSDVDTTMLMTLASTMSGSGLSEAIIKLTPGVVNDSNGFFHPLGDHAETSFQIDGQPVNDQIGKVFSTQLPSNAVQSLELNTGFPAAEYGEKTSLVVNAVTRSGLGGPPSGTIAFPFGSFGSVGTEATLGMGTSKFGFFTAVNGSRSDRFLDTPEFEAIHDHGNNGSVFVRLDAQPSTGNIFHLDTFVARNSFQIPNSLDQVGQDQRQKVLSFNVAPGYQHTVSAHTLMTVNGWVRRDHVNYVPSPNRLDDTPVTVSQERYLTSLGAKGDVSYSAGNQILKIGGQFMQTRLKERFSLGITDQTFNPVCLTASGDPVTIPTLTDPTACASAGFQPNDNVQPGLLPIDLTRGGSLFNFNDTGTINEYAAYIQDAINWGQLTLNPGLRVTRYSGLSKATGVQPRFGASYLAGSSTVLRASYARTLETPHNENLLLSSATGVGGLTEVFGAFGQQPIQPGRRNQFNVGVQQTLGRVQVDLDYWVKHTQNAAEFDVLLNTPITFPIMWRQDKLDGFGVRISTLNVKGFRLNTTMGTGRLRYFGPEVGGLIFNSPLAKVFRTDSDDKFYQTTILDYHPLKSGPWAAFTWQYDNGEVAGAVATLDDALGLTAAQQSAIGFFCGSDVATPTHGITECSQAFPNYGAKLVRIPAPGTANEDTNPPRMTPRNMFDVVVGTDNLFMTSGKSRVTLQFTIVNLMNKKALYNFLSTFGGTHFVQPRTYQVKVGYSF
jgi:hypothetical protein